MKIGVDMDGVVADFVGAFSRLSAAMHAKPLPPATRWDWWDDALTPEEFDKSWQWIRQNPQFWETLHPTQDFILAGRQVILESHSQKDDVYFITSRHGHGVQYHTTEWLIRHGIPRPHVIMAPDAVAKARVAKALGLDVFVDDKPENVTAVAPHVPVTRLFSQPWNQDADTQLRVFSLKEVLPWKSALSIH